VCEREKGFFCRGWSWGVCEEELMVGDQLSREILGFVRE
jgi:hypothetical protein